MLADALADVLTDVLADVIFVHSSTMQQLTMHSTMPTAHGYCNQAK